MSSLDILSKLEKDVIELDILVNEGSVVEQEITQTRQS